MSDTPRTDAATIGWEEPAVSEPNQFVRSDFARQLERELTASTAKVSALQDRVKELEADAARYRRLRQWHWSDGPMCVVLRPQKAVKLGADCPWLDNLDAAIDAALATQENTNG